MDRMLPNVEDLHEGTIIIQLSNTILTLFQEGRWSGLSSHEAMLHMRLYEENRDPLHLLCFVEAAWKDVYQPKYKELRRKMAEIVEEKALELCEIGKYAIGSKLLTLINCTTTLAEIARARGIENLSGDLNFLDAVDMYGNDSERNALLKNYPWHRNSDGKICKLADSIKAETMEFRKKTSKMRVGIEASCFQISAAMQISRQDYTAIFGILQSGASIAAYTDVLDVPSGFIEYHRRWPTKKPVWKEANRAKKYGQNGAILLCENDAISGKTIENVRRKVDTLNPTRVDILFTGYHEKSSKDLAIKNGADNTFHINDYDCTHVYSDMLEFRKKLQEKIAVCTNIEEL